MPQRHRDTENDKREARSNQSSVDRKCGDHVRQTARGEALATAVSISTLRLSRLSLVVLCVSVSLWLSFRGSSPSFCGPTSGNPSPVCSPCLRASVAYLRKVSARGLLRRTPTPSG